MHGKIFHKYLQNTLSLSHSDIELEKLKSFTLYSVWLKYVCNKLRNGGSDVYRGHLWGENVLSDGAANPCKLNIEIAPCASPYTVEAVASIYHKSWEAQATSLRLSPSFNPPFFPSFSWTLQGVWAEPAHALPKSKHFGANRNSLIKSTLMFNVLQKYVCIQSSAMSEELILWITFSGQVQQLGTKSGGPCIFGPPHCQKVRTPTGSHRWSGCRPAWGRGCGP